MGKHEKEKMSDDAFTFLWFMILSGALVIGTLIYKVWSGE